MKAALARFGIGAKPDIAGDSRVSPYRAANQDRILCRAGLAAVADGMGGHDDGGGAAQAVIDALDALIAPDADSARQALEECDRAIRVASTGVSGATTAVLIWDEADFHALWAGDCRIYRMRGGTLDQLSRDHRLVQPMVEAGALSPEQARRHPQGSVVTSAIGAGACRIEQVSGDVEPGDRFLICSDGLSDVVGAEEIAAALALPQPAAAVQALLDAAAPRARDDVSVVVVKAP